MRPYTLFCLAVFATSSFFAAGSSALAQTRGIVTDDSMGAERSTVRTVAPRVQHIEDGALRNGAVFHSFEAFNIDRGWTANFVNPEGVFNIFSRVTGENPSDLFGTLGVLGEADLFFINPNGVVFGPNASLNIPGSLTVSTADSLVLPDGFEFSATDPEAVPLLSVGVEAPIGVQFGEGMVAALENEAVLEVGEDLTLSAGDVVSNGVLFAPEGYVLVEGRGDVRVQEVAAHSAVLSASENLVLEESRLQTAEDLSLLAENAVRIRDTDENSLRIVSGRNLIIQGNNSVDIFALNHKNSEIQAYGDILLRSANPIVGDAIYWAEDSFSIEQLDGAIGDLYSPFDPKIYARGDIRIGNYRGNSIHIFAGGSITVEGSIVIEDREESNSGHQEEGIVLSNGTSIDIDGVSQPTVDLRAGTVAFARELTELDDDSGYSIEPDNPPPSAINVLDSSLEPDRRADIVITGGIFNNRFVENSEGERGQIYLTNQYYPNPDLQGNISVNGRTDNGRTDDITVEDLTADGSSIAAYGNAVTIDSRNNITIGHGINSSAGSSDGANITLLSAGALEITANNNTFSLLSASAAGDGGDIIVRANNNIDLIAGGIRSEVNVSDQSMSTGDGGNVSLISLEGSVNVDGNILSRTNVIDKNSGNISILAERGAITTGFLTAENTFSGSSSEEGLATDAGSIVLTAQQNIETGNITTLSELGQSGAVRLNSSNGEIRTGAISATSNNISSRNSDDTVPSNRDVILRAAGTVRVGSVSTSTTSGTSGDVTIVSDTADVVIEVGDIDTKSDEGDAGNIIVSADSGVWTNNIFSQTLSEAAETTSGNVSITSRTGEINTSSITSSSNGGNSGTLILRALQGHVRTSRGEELRTTTSSGRAGRVIVRAEGEIVTAGISSSSSTGRSGNVVLTSDTANIDASRGVISTTTFSGRAANVRIEAEDEIITAGILSSSTAGRSGNVVLTSDTADIDASQGVISTTTNVGRAGGILLTASSGRIYVNSVNSSTVKSADSAGDIRLISSEPFVMENGSIMSTTNGLGQGGDIEIRAESVSLFDSVITAASGIIFNDMDSMSDAGDERLSVSQLGNSGSITIDTTSSGNSSEGNVFLSETELSTTLQGDPETTELDSGMTAPSRAGEITIQTARLNLENNSEIKIDSSTDSAGQLEISANSIYLISSQINAETGEEIDSTGSARNIADMDSLDPAGQFTMEGNQDVSDEEFEVLINLKDPEPIMWLRNGSRITATANADASGGDIRIRTDDDDGFIIGVPAENNDIVANAQGRGNGGRVFFGNGDNSDLSTRTYVFGLIERKVETDLSDVVVFSRFGASGLIDFSDPIEDGFLELEEELLLPNNPNLDEGCQIGSSSRQAAFFDIGLGGAPSSTDELLNGNNILSEWIPLDIEESDELLPESMNSVEPLSFNIASTNRLNLLSLCTANE